MTTENATATITRETRLIPIIYDAPGVSIPVAAAKISLALQACPQDALSLGFKFARATRVTVTPDGGGRKISFNREKEISKNYIFAEKTISRAAFDADPQYQDADSARFRKSQAQKLADPQSVIYKSSLGLGVLDSYGRQNTVLITREGERLYPLSGAKNRQKPAAPRQAGI